MILYILHKYLLFLIPLLSCSIYDPGETLVNLSGVASDFKSREYKNRINNEFCNYCCLKWSDGEIIGRICEKHTMCLYHEPEVYGRACLGPIKIPLSKENKINLLAAHNRLRNKVALGNEDKGFPGPQPSASNMRMLYWDDELESFAQRWVQQCVNDYDECRDSVRFPVGQNIVDTNLVVINELVVENWYKEVNNFSSEQVAQPYRFNPQCRNYVQLVWADTYLVGCAALAYQKHQSGQISYQVMFVCNYGPAGNIPQLLIYSVGDACEKCPKGTSCNEDYPALCSLINIQIKPEENFEFTILSTCVRINLKRNLFLLIILIQNL